MVEQRRVWLWEGNNSPVGRAEATTADLEREGEEGWGGERRREERGAGVGSLARFVVAPRAPCPPPAPAFPGAACGMWLASDSTQATHLVRQVCMVRRVGLKGEEKGITKRKRRVKQCSLSLRHLLRVQARPPTRAVEKEK